MSFNALIRQAAGRAAHAPPAHEEPEHDVGSIGIGLGAAAAPPPAPSGSDQINAELRAAYMRLRGHADIDALYPDR